MPSPDSTATVAGTERPMPASDQVPVEATSQTKSLALRHFIGCANVGDAINPALVSHLTGCSTYFEWNIRNPHLLALGSVIDWATEASHVWGSGMIDPDRGFGGLRAERVWALRGKLSHAALRRQGLAVRDVPLGDPGVLAPVALGLNAGEAVKRWRLGIVPHYSDRDHPALHGLSRMADTCVIDVQAAPAEFFAQLLSCEAIASSSLHGLIFAEALGIPNLWLRFPGSPLNDFKFLDWFSTTANPQAAAYVPAGREHPWDFIGRSELRGLDIDPAALAAALPAAVVDELTGRAEHFRAVADDYQVEKLPVYVVAREPAQLRTALAALAGQSVACEPVVALPAELETWAAEDLATVLEEAGLVGWPLNGKADSVDDGALDRLIQHHQDFRSSPTTITVLLDDGAWLARNRNGLAIARELLWHDPDVAAVAGPCDVRAIARARLRGESAEITVRPTALGRYETVLTSAPGTFQMRRPGTYGWQRHPTLALVQPDGLWDGELPSIEQQVLAQAVAP